MSTVQRNTRDARLTAMNSETVDASASVIGDMGVPGSLSGTKAARIRQIECHSDMNFQAAQSSSRERHGICAIEMRQHPAPACPKAASQPSRKMFAWQMGEDGNGTDGYTP